jgi:TRAP-type transport system small permease protein
LSAEKDPTLVRVNPPTRVSLKIEEALAALAMALLCLITLGNVIARYLTNYSFAFTEEYSIVLMVIVTMLGASVAVAADRHIRIAFFVERMRPASRLAAELFSLAATTVMFALLVLLGGRVVWDEYRFEVTTPALGDPQWIYTLALPALSVLVVARAIGAAFRLWKRRRAG